MDKARCAFCGKNGNTYALAKIIGEIETEICGKVIYMTMTWLEAAPEDVFFEALEDSIFEELISDDPDYGVIMDAREDVIEEHDSADGEYAGAYKEYFEALYQMIREKMEETYGREA